LAKIYLANSYYSLGNYNDALETFSEYSGDSKIHQATAYAGMAACYEMNGDFAKSADYYKKAANFYVLKSQSSEFLLNAGINYIKSGQKENAKEVLEMIKKEYKTTNAAREVEKYLSQI